MGNVNIINHPLVKHKITLMRDEKTGTREFRILVEEVAMLMGYEAMRDLPTEDVEVKTPITTRKLPMLCGKKLAIVPILRAGLGMVSGLLALVPSAKVGHIGLYRDEVTHEPHEYYCKLPDGLDALRTAHPDIDIYVGNLDEKLNEDAYIVPGLGDAGDRIFGTK